MKGITSYAQVCFSIRIWTQTRTQRHIGHKEVWRKAYHGEMYLITFTVQTCPYQVIAIRDKLF